MTPKTTWQRMKVNGKWVHREVPVPEPGECQHEHTFGGGGVWSETGQVWCLDCGREL